MFSNNNKQYKHIPSLTPVEIQLLRQAPTTILGYSIKEYNAKRGKNRNNKPCNKLKVKASTFEERHLSSFEKLFNVSY